MKLIKHFDFINDKKLDDTIWNIEVGDKWSNQERQLYTDNPNNLYFDQGLVIRATHEFGVYKSARINTKGKFSFCFGRIEIVAKVPSGRGTWPAIWMMSDTMPYGRWPSSGEIDIMEHVGNQKDWLYTCLHTEKYNHRVNDYYYTKTHQVGLADAFHTYALTWDENAIEYYYDNVKVASYQRAMNNRDSSVLGWPFDHPFYLIINLAIGGTLGGDVFDEDFPQTFVIQSIKVSQ